VVDGCTLPGEGRGVGGGLVTVDEDPRLVKPEGLDRVELLGVGNRVGDAGLGLEEAGVPSKEGKSVSPSGESLVAGEADRGGEGEGEAVEGAAGSVGAGLILLVGSRLRLDPGESKRLLGKEEFPVGLGSSRRRFRERDGVRSLVKTAASRRDRSSSEWANRCMAGGLR